MGVTIEAVWRAVASGAEDVGRGAPGVSEDGGQGAPDDAGELGIGEIGDGGVDGAAVGPPGGDEAGERAIADAVEREPVTPLGLGRGEGLQRRDAVAGQARRRGRARVGSVGLGAKPGRKLARLAVDGDAGLGGFHAGEYGGECVVRETPAFEGSGREIREQGVALCRLGR